MRRLLLLLTTVLALVAPGVAAASGSPPTLLDGMRLGHLPAGLGSSTDFTYEFDEVGFVSRTWESRTADGWRVDLGVDVLRGARLGSPKQLHDWVIDYEQRPPSEAVYRRVTVHARPGWRSADEVFWLVRPGVAVLVRLDTSRWPAHELLQIARAVRAAADVGSPPAG